MVKTTINLDDEIYKKLVKEAVEKYGTTRTLSKLINEKLRGADITETKKRRDIVEKTAGLWKIKESGTQYVRRLRKESERRFERLGI